MKKLLSAKLIITIALVTFLSASFLVWPISRVWGQDSSGLDMSALNLTFKGGAGYPVSDLTLEQEVKAWAIEDLTRQKKESAFKIAFKVALGNFLNNIAYETAVWVGSGGEGGEPLFITEGWGSYLTDAVDNMAGTFLDKLSVAWSGGAYSNGQLTIKDDSGATILKMDICAPSLASQLAMTFGLGLKKPTYYSSRCKISTLIDNWSEAIDDEDYLVNLNTYIQAENDLGLYLQLKGALQYAQTVAERNGILEKLQNFGFKDITGKDGTIKTPGKLVADFVTGGLITDSAAREKTWVGEPVADAIAVFTNTLIGTVLQTLINGLFNSDNSSDSTDAVYDYSASASGGGVAAAALRYASLKLVAPIVGGPYDVLSQLVTCPDPANPGPMDCVLDEKFRFAIEQGLTVKQALAADWLDGQKAFGFEATQGTPGKEPDYKNGYPYRSMLVLRKYRILPVGWEIAAQYIRDFGDRAYSLAEVMGISDESNKQYHNPSDPLFGLVNPSWVLKAPEAYCRQKGPGPKIVSNSVTQGTDSDGDGDYDDEGDLAPVIVVSRENYCSDEQSCIVQNSDGSCKFYGYCASERPSFNFGGNVTCDAVYNSCQTFQNSTGQTVSYLKNALSNWQGSGDNNSCSDEVAGCRDYSFSQTNNQWTADSLYYVDNNAKDCASSNEGCHEFIRTKAGLATNLLPNADFNTSFTALSNWSGGYFNWGSRDSSVASLVSNSDGYDDQSSLQIVPVTGRGSASSAVFTLALKADSSLAGRTFAVSVYAKLKGGASNVFPIVRPNFSVTKELVNNSGSEWGRLDTFDVSGLNNTDWQLLSVKYTVENNGVDYRYLNLNFYTVEDTKVDSAKYVLYDNVMIEEIPSGSAVTKAYVDYGSNNLLYLKKPPAYYNCSDLKSDGTLNTSNDNAACANFALACTANDVGCQLYTPVSGDPAVSAIVQNQDQCPAECNNYQTYFENNTYFAAGNYQYLIANGKSCSAAAAGCDEFTNLDTVSGGGEGKEYYTQLKLCQKPDAATDATYYTWEGSDTSGYQLKTYQLRKSDTRVGSGYPPCNYLKYSSASISSCVETAAVIGNDNYSNISCDVATDTDCREFFDTTGSSYKRKLSLSVTSSNDCHPYRRTLNDYDNTGDGQNDAEADCNGSNSTNWQGVRGWWNGSSCIYYAIPNQGTMCSATEAACRQYKGNTSNDIKNILVDNFESGLYFNQADDSGWTTNEGGEMTLVSESVYAGGHSLRAKVSPTKIHYRFPEGIIKTGKTYYLSFSAKGSGSISSYFSSVSKFSGDEKYRRYFTYNSASSDKDQRQLNSQNWQQYTLGPVYIDWSVSPQDALYFVGWSGNTGDVFYLDNVKLTEVSDQVYQIKNSWNIPVACDNTLEDSQGASCGGNSATPQRCQPQYMLGCQQYKDVDNVDWYLKQFSRLCSENSAGCEALIDTQNTASPFANILSLFDGQVNYDTAADQLSYWVNDKNKQCSSEYKGCVAAGEHDYLTDWTPANTYQTVYKILAPDEAPTNLCSSQQFRCDTFTIGNSATSYFRNPINTATTTGPALGRTCEYLTHTGSTTPAWFVKRSDSNNGGYDLCPSTTDSPFYTIGAGGVTVTQPKDDDGTGYAGACPASQNMCTEFIEPLAVNGSSLIFNGSFSQTYTSSNQTWISGWVDGTSNSPQPIKAETDLELSALAGKTYQLASGLKVNPNTLYTISGQTKLDSCASGNCSNAFATLSVKSTAGSQGGGSAQAGGEYALGAWMLRHDRSKLNDPIDCPSDDPGDIVCRYNFFLNTPSDSPLPCGGANCQNIAGQQVYQNYPVVKETGSLNSTVACNSPECWADDALATIAAPQVKADGSITLTGNPQALAWVFKVNSKSIYTPWITLRSPSGGGTHSKMSVKVKILQYNDDTLTSSTQVGEERIEAPVSSSFVSKTISSLSLDPGTYALLVEWWWSTSPLSFDTQDLDVSTADIEIKQVGLTPANLVSPDSSLQTDISTGEAVATIKSSQLSGNDLTQFSGRFYTGNTTNVQVFARASSSDFVFDNIRLAPTDVVYAKADQVDTKSCSGLVNQSNGCVLFNNRDTYATTRNSSYLTNGYDGDTSPVDPDDNGNGSPRVCKDDDNLCDSTTILKVTPDRTCATWLYCKTSIASSQSTDSTGINGRTTDQCLDLGLCSAVDEKGNCSQAISIPNVPVVNFNPGRPELTANLSGYTKVGYQGKFDGDYPFDQMSQIGEAAEVLNGDFENVKNNGQPTSWLEYANGERSSWVAAQFKALADPVALNQESITGLEGRAVLKVNANHNATSDDIDVFPKTPYVISGYVNTLNLNPSDSEAIVSIQQLKINSDNQVEVINNNNSFEQKYSLGVRRDWTSFTIPIITSENAVRIRIQLGNRNSHQEVEGASYFDLIRLRPALAVKGADLANSTSLDKFGLISSKCRLYPESSALGCEYTDSTGTVFRGQRGYCLQSDSKNPRICLQWWPIDLLKGEATGGISGYSGREPLYYCAAGNLLTAFKNQSSYFLSTADSQMVDSATNPYTDKIIIKTCVHNSNTSFCEDHAQLLFQDSSTGTVYPVPLKNLNNVFGYTVSFASSGDEQGPVYCGKGGWTSSYDTCNVTIDLTVNPIRNINNVNWHAYNGLLLRSNKVYPALSSGVCTNCYYTGKIRLGCDSDEVTCVNDTTDEDFDYFNTSQAFIYEFEQALVSQCTAVVQTVTPSGQNKAWVSRVTEGSTHKTTPQNFSYDEDYAPFASILSPEPDDNPAKWSSTLLVDVLGDPSDELGSSSRAGEFYSCDPSNPTTLSCEFVGLRNGAWSVSGVGEGTVTHNHSYEYLTTAINAIKGLFAQSYGGWKWNDNNKTYESTKDLVWNPPANFCTNNTRPTTNSGDLCAVAPAVTNILVNGSSGLCSSSSSIDCSGYTEPSACQAAGCTWGSYTVPLGEGTQTMSLEFNVTIDSNQWPLTAYKVDWGDGSSSAVSGASLRDASSSSTPITLYHTYDFYTLLAEHEDSTTANRPTCEQDDTVCIAKILIQVKDNWGWCNGDLDLAIDPLTPKAGSVWGYYSNQCTAYNPAPPSDEQYRKYSWQEGPTIRVNQ